MCDPVLVAAILEELGYFDEKNEGVRDEGVSRDSLQNSGEELQKQK
jgi:hypothetical protein